MKGAFINQDKKRNHANANLSLQGPGAELTAATTHAAGETQVSSVLCYPHKKYKVSSRKKKRKKELPRAIL